MTLNNLKLALQLNNAKINQEINLLIAYVNQFATSQKDLHYIINNKLQSLDDDISQLNSDMTYQISLLDTKFTNQISTLSDDYSSHKNNTDVHITAEEREKWNNTTKYTDGTIKVHAENLTIHVTQADKDIWNATLGNAKAFAQELFNRLTSFEIVKCTELPTEDIKTMTIYFLQISPEQDDLYEEYMYIDDKWEKIGNTRIDLSDYVTKSMLQSEVDTLNDAITAKEYTFSQSITNLENKHNQDIKSINQNIETIEQNIKNIGDDVNGIHSHANKSVLDNLTQSVIDNSHTHNNKLILDKLTIDNNGNLLYNGSKVCDTDELIDALNNCATKADLDKLPIHKHSNKVLLDKLSIDSDGDLNYDGQKVDRNVGTGANHAHSNKNILDRFGIDTNNNLTYNGTEVISQFTSVDVVLLMDSLWPDQAEGGFVTKDRQYIITNDGYIFVPYS